MEAPSPPDPADMTPDELKAFLGMPDAAWAIGGPEVDTRALATLLNGRLTPEESARVWQLCADYRDWCVALLGILVTYDEARERGETN